MKARVLIRPKEGILDPQGKAVAGALRSLGFDALGEVHVGRLVALSLRAASAAEAEAAASEMCRRLLANPVTEDFTVRVLEGSAP